MLKVELHTHTSDDPVDRIPHTATQLVDHAVSLGYHALAITLHEHQLDISELTPYARERGLVLIPGAERSIEGRHVLLINFKSGTDGVRTFADLARLKQRERGLVIAPHPFFPAPTCLRGDMERYADLFDAVEYNAMFTRFLNFNRRAERWAAKHGRPLVGNCDVHRLRQLGTTYSLIDAEPHPDAICEAIAAGKTRVECRPVSAIHAASVMSSLIIQDILAIGRRSSAVESKPRARLTHV